MSKRSNELYEFGPFRLDPAERLLLREGAPVTLTPKAFDLLVVLVMRAGRLLTREEILNQVWADAVVEEGNLSYTVSLLRKALGDDGDRVRYVETVPKLGYRFVAPVMELGGGPAAQTPAPAATVASPQEPSRAVPPWLWAVGAIVLLVILGALAARLVSPGPGQPPAARAMARFEVTLPPGFTLSESVPAISPDGRRLALAGNKRGDQPQLWVRPLSTDSVVALPGTEGASGPFWSPDSRRIGFVSDGQLKTTDAAGGAVETLCAATPGRGTWSRDGVIVFRRSDDRLHMVPASGGTPRPVTSHDASIGEFLHILPFFLPDGRHFLFIAVNLDSQFIRIGSLDSTEVTRVYDGGASPTFAAGYLVFLRQRGLMAMPFDPMRRQALGPARPLTTPFSGDYSVSDTGTIVARPIVPLTQMVWYGIDGTRLGVVGATERSWQLDVSSSGSHAIVARSDEAGHRGLWVFDLTTGTSQLVRGPRLPEEPDWWLTPADPVWSPDERQIAFTAQRRVFVIDLRSGREELLADFPERMVVDDWTPDGTQIVARTTGRAVYSSKLSEERGWRQLVDTPYGEDQLQVSPDGRWVAFNSDESGEWEVYVARFSEFTDKRQVSGRGGVQPRWQHDGKALFYLAPDGTMMRVAVAAKEDVMTVSAPEALFRTRLTPEYGISQYDIARDGRFLVIEPIGPPLLTVLTDWAAGVATQ